MKRNKKGFTIVELVIVIAVIAILSAILIPTFVNLTDKAQKSALQSDLASAYSMYASEAADGVIDADKTTPIAIATQAKVTLAKDAKYYTYTSNAWNTEPAASLGEGYELVSTAEYSVFGGYTVYYHA